MRISKKQLTADLKDSIFDPRAPGRFSAVIEGMTGDFIANTAVMKIREAMAAFPNGGGEMLDRALRDGISLLAYSRSLLKQTTTISRDGQPGPPYGQA